MEINPDVEVNEKELTKLQKFLKACKKVIAMPFKKLGKMLKEHKKGVVAGAVITAITAFSIGAIVTKKKNDDIRKSNETIRQINTNRINEHNKNVIEPLKKQKKEAQIKFDKSSEMLSRNIKKEQELSKTLEETESLCRELQTRIEHIKNSNKRHQRFGKNKKELKAAQTKAEGLRSDIHRTQERITKAKRINFNAMQNQLSIPDIEPLYSTGGLEDEIPLVQNFYTVLAGKLGNVSNTLQSGLTKMRREAA